MADDWTRNKFDWLDAVAADPLLPATASRLAIVLLRYLNRQTGDAWPSIPRLAADMSTAENTVRAGLKALKDRGHLAIETGGGRAATNRYTMQTPADKPCKNLEGKKSDTLQNPELNPSNSEHKPFRKLNPNPKKNPIKEPSENIYFGAGAQSTSDLFENFWSLYPKKIGKQSARKAFEAAIKNGADPESIISGASNYRDQRFASEPIDAAEREKFTLNPATFLNQRRWEDEPAPVANARAGPARREETSGVAKLLAEAYGFDKRNGTETAGDLADFRSIPVLDDGFRIENHGDDGGLSRRLPRPDG